MESIEALNLALDHYEGTLFFFEPRPGVCVVARDPKPARQLLKRFEPNALHYEVAAKADRPQGRMTCAGCNEELNRCIFANLEHFNFHTDTEEGKRAAAVAITIVHVAQDPELYDIPFEPSLGR
mmetsp:Transcript_23500/g.65373  ORF Transcript_23500/g.65373 Transcript_23500/m.65373 type:complete len:124 (+) Transcript_23500:194-565(+)